MNLSEIIYSAFHYTPSKPLNPIILDSQPINFKIAEILNEQEKRAILFKSMTINKNIVDLKGKILVKDVPSIVDKKTDQILSNKLRYETIAHKFINPIQWYHIAFIHEMECSQNFNCYLGNGQPLNKVTTIVPKGRGPFNSFELGAIDSIKIEGLYKVEDWSIGNALYIFEKFNGIGYSKYRGINSPYLWSGSNHYISGKYISDKVYSPTAVSTQIGIALLFKNLAEKINLSFS